MLLTDVTNDVKFEYIDFILCLKTLKNELNTVFLTKCIKQKHLN